MKSAMEVDVHQKEDSSVIQVFQTSHVMLKILKYCAEDNRKKLFMVGNRTWQGDLKGFLSIRLVNSYFNRIVSMAVKREFKSIKISTDHYFIRCNDFSIGKHLKPQVAERRRRNHDDEEHPDAPEPRERFDSESSSSSDSEIEDGIDEDPDREEVAPAIQISTPEDARDVDYVKKFFKWLEKTFDPLVEQVTYFDSWSFKPCTLPESWLEKSLSVFNSMHPDMEHCTCEQCNQTVRKCRRFFGPLSFPMAENALREQSVSYGILCCTDAFLADVAMEYTETKNEVRRFDADRFLRHYGQIRVHNLKLAVQSIPQYEDEDPRPQPLEIIQLLVKTWEVRSIQFDIVEILENEFYNSRCAWMSWNVFTEAHFVTFRQDIFSEPHHLIPYRTVGTIDKECLEDLLPIIYLRQDSDPPRVPSSLSLASAVSNSRNSHEYAMQGRIVFNMFKANKFLFVDVGHVDFYGILQTTNWLKYTIRQIMRILWGTRQSPVRATGKTVYWIHYVTSLETFMKKIWNEHIETLLQVNFPLLKITMHTEKAFTECENRVIATYDDERVRPDLERWQLEAYYLTFYDELRDNTTNLKIVRLDH